MYRLGKRKQRSKKRYAAIWLAVVVLVVVGGSYGYHKLQARSAATISNGAPVVRFVNANTAGQSHFNEGLFTVDLPSGWKLASHVVPPSSPYNLYTFQASSSDATRAVSIYQDTLPTSMAVNRVVSVSVQGGTISHGMVSDNCINFASDASQSTQQAVTQHIAQLKWDGVNFLCDLGNYNRNVTGTSSQGAINSLTLTSPTSGSHNFFFVYNDTNLNPDYTILYGVLDSFHLK